MEQEKIDQTVATQGAADGDAKTDTPVTETGATAKAAPAKKGGKTKKEASAKKGGTPAKVATTPKAPQDTTGGETAPKTTANGALEKIGRDALKRNPSMRAVFVTADGTAFGTANDADNHARTLENTGVTTVTE